ncbi:BPTI/Kunitz domain-containing protein-like [Mytilus edulis]|uniref:BPTI/Kunitz domain-containing protein-like n=1 Tax=Mytilus edulis TaxID=6550 RepID=UPI0039F03827
MKPLPPIVCICCMALLTFVPIGTSETTTTGHPHNNDCLLPTVVGPCDAYFPRFSYDHKTNLCKQFVYGGCRGNANNFLTKGECEKTCVTAKMKAFPTIVCICCMVLVTFVSSVIPETTTTGHHHNNDCLLPTYSGPCDAYFPRYSYDHKTNSCTQFVYGGCRGNGNNFLSMAECEKNCVTTR